MNDIIDKYITKLFTNYFDEIKTKEEIYSDYSWNNISKMFNSLYNNLLTTSDSQNFTKNYYLVTLFYVNYTNFLKYINHKDIELSEIYDFINTIKYNPDFLKLFFDNKEDFKNIIATLNPFIKKKINVCKNLSLQQIKELITNVKQLDFLYTDENFSLKKILNIILYRHILSNNTEFKSFHLFFVKNIIESPLTYKINFNFFMDNIPNYKAIVNLNVSHDIRNNLGIQLSQFVNYLIKDYPNIKMSIVTNLDKTKHIELLDTKFGGKIVIKKSADKTNTINIYQQNINLIGFNIKELKNQSFIKKTNNFIEIQYCSSIINNLSNLLHLTHLLTCGLKIIETYPGSLNECMYPIDYNKYYYKSFCNFLTFIKSNVNIDMSYNRFLIDLIKYYYIYSYYDYYFYYNTNLINTIIERIKHKNNIFSDFCTSLKYIFKLPDEMTSYPPFFAVNDDIDNLIYYNLEIPNYFKFCDLISAVIDIFEIDIINSNKFDLLKIIKTIKCNENSILPENKTQNNNQQNNNQQNNNKNSSSSSSSEINETNDDKANAFIELNMENSDNYALNTELNF